MGYDFHIHRGYTDDGHLHIPLEEWKTAIESTDDVRLTSEKFHVIDFGNGKKMKTPVPEGSAEIFINHDWHLAFHFGRGVVTFSGRAIENTNNSDPVWRIATTLARKLGAQIYGDDSGPYDLDV